MVSPTNSKWSRTQLPTSSPAPAVMATSPPSDLCWLPIPQRIHYEILIIILEAPHDLAPSIPQIPAVLIFLSPLHTLYLPLLSWRQSLFPFCPPLMELTPFISPSARLNPYFPKRFHFCNSSPLCFLSLYCLSEFTVIYCFCPFLLISFCFLSLTYNTC